jgi:thioredoxin-related protein
MLYYFFEIILVVYNNISSIDKNVDLLSHSNGWPYCSRLKQAVQQSIDEASNLNVNLSSCCFLIYTSSNKLTE